MSKNKTAKESLNEALGDLEAARDEARLRLHLLSLDAKERWHELEANMRDIESKAREVGEQLGEESAGRLRDGARAIRDFVARHADP